MSTVTSSEPRDQTGASRGDTAIALVESLTHDARGVARVGGKATFIEGALPGEQIRFRYHNKRPRYDTGAVVEVLRASVDRAVPPCPYYGRCGGCTLQHMTPPAQVAAKERVLAETLERIGRARPERWLAPIQGPALGYRRRARLGVRFVPRKGGVLVGFRERRHSYIAPLEDCLTLDPRLARLLPRLREVIGELSRPDRLPQVEVAAGDDRCAAVFRHLEPLSDADLAHLRVFAEATGIAIYLQPGASHTVRPYWPIPEPPLTYALPEFDLSLAFAPTDFVQVNSAVNRELVKQVVALLDLTAGDVVLDLFCGLGNFTLAAARRAGRVLGYEASAALIDRARANARGNGIDDVEFHVADLYDPSSADVVQRARCNKLLLDPPRAGAMEVIKAIARDGPTRVAYVSCNPATLARDSEYLVHVLGYRLEAAGVADMFPQTSHIESIALFTRS